MFYHCEEWIIFDRMKTIYRRHVHQYSASEFIPATAHDLDELFPEPLPSQNIQKEVDSEVNIRYIVK